MQAVLPWLGCLPLAHRGQDPSLPACASLQAVQGVFWLYGAVAAPVMFQTSVPARHVRQLAPAHTSAGAAALAHSAIPGSFWCLPASHVVHVVPHVELLPCVPAGQATDAVFAAFGL